MHEHIRNDKWIGVLVPLLGILFIFGFINLVIGADISTSAEVSNQLPVASSVELNGVSDITLTANLTTLVPATGVITDTNGCDDISSVTATLFRSDLAGGSGAADNGRTHFSTTCASQGDCAGGGDNTETFDCEFNITWYADPTDLGSDHEDTDWTFNMTPQDSEGGVSDSTQQEILTLTSLSVQTGSLAFGLIALGDNTVDVNQNTTLANHGNEALDIIIKGYGSVEGDGYSMVCTSGNVDVSMIEHDTTGFTWGSGVQLTDIDDQVDLDLDRGSDASPRPVKSIYYGLGFPATGISGTCSGTIVLTAESDPTMD